jgi:hypothetical protein
MFTTTGHLAIAYAAPVAIRDTTAPDGLRVDDQLSVTLKSASDEKEYQFNLPITEKTPALKQPDEWADLPVSFFGDADLGDSGIGVEVDLLDEEESVGAVARQDKETAGEEATPVDESGTAVYLWGRRASGFAFAPGAPVSAAIYDTALEERRSGKTLDGGDPCGGWVERRDAVVSCRGAVHARGLSGDRCRDESGGGGVV